MAALLGWTGVGETATVSCSSAKDIEFAPSWGQVKIGEDSTSRYITQYLYWHDTKRLKWFSEGGIDSPATYEAEALFDDSEGKAYGTKPSGYWSSTLPSAYVDTNILDRSGIVGNKDEPSVTIGSASAYLIKPAQLYSTHTRMKSGGGSESQFKLQAQRGKRVPSYCFSTYCSFGCKTTGHVKTRDWSDTELAPGCYQYKYKWTGTAQTVSKIACR
jgi:hypothetical protein